MEPLDINELFNLDHDELVKTLVKLSRVLDEKRTNEDIDTRPYFKQPVRMNMIIKSRDLIVFTFKSDEIEDIPDVEVDAATYLYYYDL